MGGIVLVTGGSRGIGRGICVELAKRGYSVAINYAGNEAAAMETKNLCEQQAVTPTQRFIPFKADITDHRAREAMVDSIFNTFGDLTALVNNAGVAPLKRADLLDMSEESYDRVMGTNLRSPFFLTQLIARRWLSRDDSTARTIVFLSSISAQTASINRGEYCMSKAGISMAVALFATRLAAEGITVYEVRPGIIKTDMTTSVEATYDRLITEGLVPQRRWGFPEDLGRTVSALLSGDFGFSTGSIIPVDGGLQISRL